MDGLNKINRRQFLSHLLSIGAAIALPRLVHARHEVLEPPILVVVPYVLADEEPDEAEAPDIAWGVNSANWTEEERQQKQQQFNEFEALQASRRVARRAYLKKVIMQWEADGRATPWDQWHETHFKKIYVQSRVHAVYLARDDLRLAMGLTSLLS